MPNARPVIAARAAGAAIIRSHRPADHRSRARRWHDAVAELTELQALYAGWFEPCLTTCKTAPLPTPCGPFVSSP